MLKHVLVQWVRDLQPADKCECKDILTAIENLGKQVLEVPDVGFEAINLPHLNREKVIVVLLDLLTKSILNEEHFSYLHEVVKGIERQRVQPIRDHTFQAGWKG